ncbi:MAG: APC family permease [Actinobacteria bacterium]|jgi:amino acid transporter|nr:APC family permease [Actinomycetota bacterium]MBT3688143.1 APC family permease [Actinomycetota bacterium]MBT4036451.1 APC family permease [Actinomycetota bacterium]MBT4278414.1 APC family permease [Actinomycetota bacterium]MBT4342902.1 APC family permease [Actinomycetota bacterium]
MAAGAARKLTRSLELRHVFALSTGAMLSSGLFLLPGLAAAKAGPAAIVAYLLAGTLAIPAMLSVAELSTALPKAGGTYYFLERALGPAVGTVAGFGTWLSLILKDAFAMVGMSAYLVLIVDVDGTTLALVLIGLFTLVNVVGSKASASVQLVMVAFILVVMAWFLVGGFWEIRSNGIDSSRLDPFFTSGWSGVLAVTGLVFVSYGGLTKVASAAEEVEDPSHRIPLGMMLSLGVATLLYTLGVLVAVVVVPPEILHEDLAPIHTAAVAVLPTAGVWLVVLAALAAFASAVNAGILAAARYPMAMARDGLLPARLGGLSRYGTPAVGVVITGAMIALVVVAFDAEAIAKLASAFVLLTLGMVNLAVLVLRASRIVSYAPAFRTPFYPFTQFAGIAVSVLLISQLGLVPLVFIGIVTVVAWVWHHLYATPRTNRAGAIRHVFERWGEGVDRGLDREMSAAMAGHGLRGDDDYAGLIARAAVLSVSSGTDIAEAAERVSTVISDRIGLSADLVSDQFLETGSLWIQPSDDHPTATPVALFEAIDDDQLVIVRAAAGIRIPAAWGGSGERVNALFFLAGTAANPGRSLRLAGELAGYLHGGARLIGSAGTEAEVKSALLPGVTLRQYTLLPEGHDVGLIGERVGDIEWLDGVELASVTRFGVSMPIDADLVLEPDDQLTLLGPDAVMPVAGQPAPLVPVRP